MQGGRDTVAPDLGDEYAARFGLRDLVEAWMDRVMHELPTDPYQLLMDEANSQRQISGGVVTCPNPWCGMSMPGYNFEEHRALCNAQEHWTRCVRCNERVEAARLSTHLTTCRAEPCRFCGGLALPRMMHLCPIQQLFEADRATNALRYRRHQKQALAQEAAVAMAAATDTTPADAADPSCAALQAPLNAHERQSRIGANGHFASFFCSPTHTAQDARDAADAHTLTQAPECNPEQSPLHTSTPSLPFRSPHTSPQSPELPDQAAATRTKPEPTTSITSASSPSGTGSGDEARRPDFVFGQASSAIPALSSSQKGHLSCIQRLWRRNMAGERYRVAVLSRVWESLDMYEERMGVSQSLDGGGFLEGIVESLNGSEDGDDGQDDLDDAMAQSYNHPISSNASSYGDEDNDRTSTSSDGTTRNDSFNGAGRRHDITGNNGNGNENGNGDGLRSSSLAELDELDGDDEDAPMRRITRGNSFSSTGTGISGATQGGFDNDAASFRGVVVHKGSFAMETGEAAEQAYAHAHEHDDDEDDEDADDDDADENETHEHSQASSIAPQHSVLRPSRASMHRRSQTRRKHQQLWLRVSTTPDVNGAYMSEESMWALTRLSGQREVFRASLVVAVVRAATRILLERPVVQRITTPPRGSLVVVGDLHGQMKDLLHLLRVTGGPSPNRYFVFNGDLVDRGPYGCEVIVHVFALLCTYPRYVYINRGNHEDRRTNQEYGFLAELFGKYGVKSSRIHRILAESYTAMPLMTIVDQRYCIVHGGVPRDDCTLQEIEDIGRVKRVPVVEQKTRQERLLVDLLWNDPVEKYQSRQIGDRHQGNGWRSSKRGCGAEYLLNITTRFLKRNGLSMVIRSHDVKPGGFEMIHNNQCVTVFSASNYAGVSGNRGAVAVLQSESKYPTYQTWLLQKDTVVRRRGSLNGVDGDAATCDDGSGSEVVEDELAEDLLEEDPRVVHDEFIRSFYGEYALLELVKAYVDFSTEEKRASTAAAAQTDETSSSAIVNTNATAAAEHALSSSTASVSTKGMTQFRLAPFMSEPTILQQLKTIRMLRELIYLNRYSLLVAFNGVDEMRTGVVYKIEWCVVMREVTDLDVPWYYLCQFLAPRLILDGIPAVEYVRFLRHYDAPFAQDYRPEWQRSMVRRTFSDLDLPEDILRAFQVYDNSGSGGGGNRGSTPSLSQPSPMQLPGNSRMNSLLGGGGGTSSDALTSSTSCPLEDTASSSAPAASQDRTGVAGGVGSGVDTARHTSMPSSSVSIGSPVFRSPSGPPPLQSRSPALSFLDTNTDISLIAIDFVTFASRVRSISPVAATFEDSEIYCLFRFFDEEMHGHVYLDDFINRVDEVLNEDGDEDDESRAELLLSGQDLDFGCVSVNEATRRPHSSSSSSSSSSSADHPSPLAKKGGGLLARTASNVGAMRRGGPSGLSSLTAARTAPSSAAPALTTSTATATSPRDAAHHSDSSSSSCSDSPPMRSPPLHSAPLRPTAGIDEHDGESGDGDGDGEDEYETKEHSTHTRPPHSASVSCRVNALPSVEVIASAPRTALPTSGPSSPMSRLELSFSDASGNGSSHSDEDNPRETDPQDDETRQKRLAAREAAKNTPLPLPRVQLAASVHADSKPLQPDAPKVAVVGNTAEVDVDAPFLIHSHNHAQPPHSGSGLVEMHTDEDKDAPAAATAPLGVSSHGDTSKASASMPMWKSDGSATTKLDTIDLATATTKEVLEAMHHTQLDRAVRMPWLYPTLIRVQEQLMHRGSDERTYRVFRALNRNHDGKLTQKEFWGLIRFSNTRVDKPVTEEQSNVIFQCLHDDNLIRVQEFCNNVLDELDERALYEQGTAVASARKSILITRLQDEALCGYAYVTALEFVSYFSVVIPSELTMASSPCNTNTNTMLTEELGEHIHALRLEPSDSELFGDAMVPAASIFEPRIVVGGGGPLNGNNGYAAPALTATIGGVTRLLSLNGTEGHRPVSHSSAAEASSGSLNRCSTSAMAAPQGHNFVHGQNTNKSFSSRSLSVMVPGAGGVAHPAARMSLFSSNTTIGLCTPSQPAAIDHRHSFGENVAVVACLEHLGHLFDPSATLAEMLQAYQTASPSSASPPPLPAITMSAPFPRRTARSFVGTMGFQQGHGGGGGGGLNLLSADPLGESVQTLSMRSNATASILSTPMPMQPAEHRITSNALLGMGGFGQTAAPPTRGSAAFGGAAAGGHTSARISIVAVPSMAGSVMGSGGGSPTSMALAAAAAGVGVGSVVGAGPSARGARFTMTVPAPPAHGRGKRRIGAGSSTTSTTSGLAASRTSTVAGRTDGGPSNNKMVEDERSRATRSARALPVPPSDSAEVPLSSAAGKSNQKPTTTTTTTTPFAARRSESKPKRDAPPSALLLASISPYMNSVTSPPSASSTTAAASAGTSSTCQPGSPKPHSSKREKAVSPTPSLPPAVRPMSIPQPPAALASSPNVFETQTEETPQGQLFSSPLAVPLPQQMGSPRVRSSHSCTPDGTTPVPRPPSSASRMTASPRPRPASEPPGLPLHMSESEVLAPGAATELRHALASPTEDAGPPSDTSKGSKRSAHSSAASAATCASRKTAANASTASAPLHPPRTQTGGATGTAPAARMRTRRGSKVKRNGSNADVAEVTSQRMPSLTGALPMIPFSAPRRSSPATRGSGGAAVPAHTTREPTTRTSSGRARNGDASTPRDTTTRRHHRSRAVHSNNSSIRAGQK